LAGDNGSTPCSPLAGDNGSTPPILLGLALHRWRFFLKKEGRLSTALERKRTAYDNGAVKSKQ
jgi:hypothetical protein